MPEAVECPSREKTFFFGFTRFISIFHQECYVYCMFGLVFACVRACESTCRRYWNDFTAFHEILYKLQAGADHAMCVFISNNQQWAYQYDRHLTDSRGANAALLYLGWGWGLCLIQISVGVPAVLSKGLRGFSTSLRGRFWIVPGKAMTVSF